MDTFEANIMAAAIGLGQEFGDGADNALGRYTLREALIYHRGILRGLSGRDGTEADDSTPEERAANLAAEMGIT